MFLAIVFLFFGILAWVAVGVLLYFRRETLRKTELMRRVETSATADVPNVVPGALV